MQQTFGPADMGIALVEPDTLFIDEYMEDAFAPDAGLPDRGGMCVGYRATDEGGFWRRTGGYARAANASGPRAHSRCRDGDRFGKVLQAGDGRL